MSPVLCVELLKLFLSVENEKTLLNPEQFQLYSHSAPATALLSTGWYKIKKFKK